MDDRDQMDRRRMWLPWALTSVALLVVAFAAMVIGARLIPVSVSGEPVVHAWHFGFPGFFWIFLMFWIFFGFRRMWWWGGYPYCRPWRSRRYHPYDDEREWEEWHRREHQRMDESRARGSSTPPTGGASGNTGRD